MSKFRAMTLGFLSNLGPQPNPFMEQAKELADSLDPTEKAHGSLEMLMAQTYGEEPAEAKAASASRERTVG